MNIFVALPWYRNLEAKTHRNESCWNPCATHLPYILLPARTSQQIWFRYMLDWLDWNIFEKTQLSKSGKHTPTLRVFFTGKLPLGSNTSPFGPVISKKSGFLTYPQPPLALKNPCINRSALSCPWKMKAQRIMLYCSQQSHILIPCEYKNMKKVEITGSHGS